MKKLIVLMLFVGMITLVGASIDNIGTINRGDCVDLIQICPDCTYNNISTVLYPNKTIALSEVVMTQSGTYYNYTFCSTDTLGEYLVNGYGDLSGTKTTWNYDFEVTGTGYELTTSRTILQVGLLAILILLFIGGIFLHSALPSNNMVDDERNIISISKLKFLRPIVLMLNYVMLMVIFFVGANISIAYLGTTMFSTVFFAIYKFMFVLMYPIIILMFIFIFVKAFRDKELTKLYEPVGGYNQF